MLPLNEDGWLSSSVRKGLNLRWEVVAKRGAPREKNKTKTDKTPIFTIGRTMPSQKTGKRLILTIERVMPPRKE